MNMSFIGNSMHLHAAHSRGKTTSLATLLSFHSNIAPACLFHVWESRCKLGHLCIRDIRKLLLLFEALEQLTAL